MLTTREMNVANRRLGLRAVGVALAIAAVSATAFGQAFSSGSDGSDGALNVPAGSGAVIFDPFDTARWGHVLDADGDGVYNFTTITIASGVTLKLRGDKVNRPVYWLASGVVAINGTLDLSGETTAIATTLCLAGGNTVTTTDPSVRRQVTIPGSGGYAGGAGGRVSPSTPPTAGDGPGGGAGGVAGVCTPFGYTLCGRGGAFTGNRFLVPLVGGSGGEGSTHSSQFGMGGGAGGGAILVASSTSISVTGTITTVGGGVCGSNWGGGGSGGAIRLVAPALTGSGTLNVAGGPATSGGGGVVPGGSGRVRLEGSQVSTTFNVSPSSAVTRGALAHPSTVRPASSVRVSAVDGVPIAPNPAGSFVVPDAAIEKGAPVSLDIQASGIPPGTVVTLKVYPEVPVDPTTVYLPPVLVTLTGTLQSSTGTAMLAFPFGFSRCFVQATWGQ